MLPAQFTAPPGIQDDETAGLYHFDQIAPLLTREQIGISEIETYRSLGFLAVQRLISDADIRSALDALAAVAVRPDEVLVEYEKWAAERPSDFSGDRLLDGVRKLQRFVGSDTRLAALAMHPKLIGIVEEIIGDTPVLMQDMALLKPPGGGREKPWHQDKAFFNLRLDEPVVGVWIALDDATAANGAMHIMPGSHRDGPVVHFARRDFQICDSWVQTNRDTVVPLPAGGALFFDGFMHHGTPPNHTDTRRRALQFHYVRRDAVPVDVQERLAVFGSEGRDASC